MKSIIKLLLIAGMLLPALSQAHNPIKKDSTEVVECLKVTGLALDEQKFAVDGVQIRLFKQNDMMEQIELTNVEHHSHNFSFTLEANEYYTVQVSKPGFVERWVVFYTHLPSDINVETLYGFEFEVILLKEKKMDDYYLDYPIGIIHYNKKNDAFESNLEYTKFIKNKIKEAEEAAKLNNELPKTIAIKN